MLNTFHVRLAIASSYPTYQRGVQFYVTHHLPAAPLPINEPQARSVVTEEKRDTAEANALLIAAAPELLGALRMAVGAVEQAYRVATRDLYESYAYQTEAMKEHVALKAAYAAIAKAEGR